MQVNPQASSPYRVLFVHASHTGGHAAAAQAMAEELNTHPDVQAESLNLLSLTSEAERQQGLKAHGFVTQQFPSLRKMGFQLAFSGAQWACGIAGLAIDRRASKAGEMLAGIQERKPDLIVATHSVAARMLNYWKGQEQISAPIHCVPTDFRTHRMWKQDCIEHYYVAPGGSKDDLVGFGVEPERIHETGIPIRAPKLSPLSQTELKSKLGLDPDKPMVLISGGSLGLQPFGKLVSALRERPEDFQIVCIAAKNEKARQELEALPQEGQPLHVTGLVKNMEEWIQASDVVLTKPGGLTCSEILAQGKPMVFAQLYEGLETPLIERMVEAGVARAGSTVEATAQEVGQLLADPAALKARAQELSRPHSSASVAGFILSHRSGKA
jgi:processive 1,2-diacylglycerol beta-glucosyltransferase